MRDGAMAGWRVRWRLCFEWVLAGLVDAGAPATPGSRDRRGNLTAGPLGEVGGGFSRRWRRVRPAWAHAWRCKSSRELATASEENRNCMRVTDCGEEAGIENCGPMNKNRIRGVVDQGERPHTREALVAKGQAT